MEDRILYLLQHHIYKHQKFRMRFSAIATVVLSLSRPGQAARLFVSSYSGNITTLDVTNTKDGVSLKAVAISQGCAPNPSWLEYNSKTSILYFTD